MNKLIAYYEINKIKYYITQIKNNKIIFLKSDKSNNFSINLTNNELKIINKIYNSLKPDLDNSIYLKDYKVNGNEYKIYLDKKNNNYFWLPTEDIYNDKDNTHLNFKYNHQMSLIYTNELEDNKNSKTNNQKFYSKLIHIGKTIIPVFLSATICLTLLNSSNIIKPESIDYQPTIAIETTENFEEVLETIATEIEEQEEQKREYNYEEIKQAINDNPYLSEEEKDLLYKIKFVFDDNSKFMNLDLVIDNIRTLKTEYNANIGGGEAAYNIKKNLMIFESTDFQSTKKAQFIHEFLHCMQGTSIDFIGELSTEFFTKETMVRLYKENIFEKEFFLSEYAKKEYKNGNLKLESEEDWINYLYKNKRFSSGYEGYANLYTILAEIIEPDALRHFQFNPKNYEEIINKLISIDKKNNKEESNLIKESRAYQLIDSINNLRVYSFEFDGYTYSKNATDFCNKLNYYYKIEKGLDLTEDPITSLYIEYAGRLEFDFENPFMKYLEEKYDVKKTNTIITKTYLSNAQEKTLLSHYNPNMELDFLEITKHIEYDYNDYLHPIPEHIKERMR